jgi:hypothetical protein
MAVFDSTIQKLFEFRASEIMKMAFENGIRKWHSKMAFENKRSAIISMVSSSGILMAINPTSAMPNGDNIGNLIQRNPANFSSLLQMSIIWITQTLKGMIKFGRARECVV